ATTAEVMTLHESGKTAPFAHADYVDAILGLEQIHFYRVALLGVFASRGELHLANKTLRRHVGFGEMSLRGLGRVPYAAAFHQCELCRLVTFFRGRLALHHHARTGLQYGHRHHLAVGAKDL